MGDSSGWVGPLGGITVRVTAEGAEGKAMRNVFLRSAMLSSATSRIVAVTALVASLVLVVPASDASARAAWSQCGGPGVTAMYPPNVSEGGSFVDSVAVRAMSCRRAALIIKRCIRNYKVPGWRVKPLDRSSFVLKRKHGRAGAAGHIGGGGSPLCLLDRP